MENIKKKIESLLIKLSALIILLFVFVGTLAWSFPAEVKAILYFALPISIFYGIPTSFTIDKMVEKKLINRKIEYAFYFISGSIIMIPIFLSIETEYIIGLFLTGGIISIVFKFLNEKMTNKKINKLIVILLPISIWCMLKL